MDRILIVDDEFLIRYTLEEGLKDRGYDAYSAATVEEISSGCAPSRQSPRKQCRDG